MTTSPPARPAPPAQLRLGIWGPPSSGKTTFLAALKIATYRSELPGNWIMNGTDPDSVHFLQEQVELLTKHRTFPEGTTQQSPLLFRFTGEQSMPRRWPRPPVIVRDAFELDVLDVAGSDYLRPSAMTEDNPLINHLQQCQGIVYLFDPRRDAHEGDAFDYFNATLEELGARVMQGAHHGSRLPHWVAVCITKFDHPYVYQLARNGGFTRPGEIPPYFPAVEDWAAEEFFEKLSRNDTTNTDLVANALPRYFYKQRVRYFVSSSIGFYYENGRFRPTDYDNTENTEMGMQIRGKVHPINVLEPLLWLHNSLKGAQ